MKLPRDLSGEKVASLLARRYGYRVIRTKGSHMTATLTSSGNKRHSVTVPKHRAEQTVSRVLCLLLPFASCQ